MSTIVSLVPPRGTPGLPKCALVAGLIAGCQHDPVDLIVAAVGDRQRDAAEVFI
jgi:hypothetical protein